MEMSSSWESLTHLQVLVNCSEGLVDDTEDIPPIKIHHVSSLSLWWSILQKIDHIFCSQTFRTQLLI